jgi:hypothetical protein
MINIVLKTKIYILYNVPKMSKNDLLKLNDIKSYRIPLRMVDFTLLDIRNIYHGYYKIFFNTYFVKLYLQQLAV